MTGDLMEKRGPGALPPDDRRCTARSKQSGERCKRYATPGAPVCVIHGSRAPQVQRKAAERLAEQAARKTLASLDETSPVVDPFAALEDVAGQAVALVDVLKGQVAELKEIRYRGGPGSGTEQLRAELAVYLSALGRAESILGRIVSLDLDARRLRLQEAQAGLVVAAFARVLAHRDLGLDAEHQRIARRLIARELGVPATIEARTLEPGR